MKRKGTLICGLLYSFRVDVLSLLPDYGYKWCLITSIILFTFCHQNEYCSAIWEAACLCASCLVSYWVLPNKEPVYRKGKWGFESVKGCQRTSSAILIIALEDATNGLERWQGKSSRALLFQGRWSLIGEDIHWLHRIGGSKAFFCVVISLGNELNIKLVYVCILFKTYNVRFTYILYIL